MNVLGVIPARYASTRLEGKMLLDLCGKPVLQHTWERARQASILDDIIIATDDERIQQVAATFGAKTVLTSKDHLSGTDRIVEASARIDTKIVINIQGDEPLIDPNLITLLGESLLKKQDAVMATLAIEISDKKDLYNPNVVKVVKDCNGRALYFSRSPIPFLRNEHTSIKIFRHIGMYAYTKEFLLQFSSLAPSMIEQTESLEQLRVLENGYGIHVIEVAKETIGVDTKEDLEKVRAILQHN